MVGMPALSDPADQAVSDAVQIDGVSVRFTLKRTEVTALEDIDLRVQPGELCSIVGPSGCGKSTLLKVVAGLVRPATGTTTLLGRGVDKPRSDIGYVFQRAALAEWRSARRNILLQAEMRHMDRKEAARRADELIDMVGLRGFEDAMPYELSGGMQQRVSLCRALLHRPPVLLMDEPFGALDALTREDINVEMRRIWRETGTTILLVTHSIAEAVYLSSRVVVMSPRPGRIVEDIEIDLGAEREDYAETVSKPAFGQIAGRLRRLLGTQSSKG